MSRADEEAIVAPRAEDDEPPPGRWAGQGAPGVGGALRRALVDFYYHSLRLVGVNVAWGLGYLVVLYVLFGLGWLPALAAAAVLGVLWTGVVRLAVLIVRGHDVMLSDAFGAWSRWLVPALVTGGAMAMAATLLTVNVVIGLSTGDPVGLALTTLSAWSLVFLWLFGLAFWPLLVDPDRDGLGVRGAARLAALVVLARPLHVGALGVVLAVVAAISTVAIAAILSISAAYVALAGSHFLLPAADELEARLARRTG